MGMIEWFKNWLYGPQQKLNYPNDFALVDFTQHAMRLGVKDDKNKIIKRYTVNRFGNYQLKKYRYSEERIFVLQEVHKIPIFDKTKLNVRFPVHSRILPGEAQFIVTR